uniref:SUZ domain-containing protein n=1 Tax=Caenorhabditis tropicalis TaxID=1561998 RepID=A0A1I7TZ87_9PELO
MSNNAVNTRPSQIGMQKYSRRIATQKSCRIQDTPPSDLESIERKREQYLEKQGRVSSPSPRRKPFIGLLDSDDDTENSESESVESGNSSKRNESSQKKIKEPQSSTYFPDLSSDEE